jgi:mRNA interferase RelE/StbE
MRSSVSYSLRIKASAVESLRRVSTAERLRLIEAIDRLATEPTAGGVLKGEFRGLRRLRVGRYRIGYEADEGELTILVIRIGHRKDVYR